LGPALERGWKPFGVEGSVDGASPGESMHMSGKLLLLLVAAAARKG
jgi:hypothetical protein